ncbi:MAG: site-specific integrase [Clostridiales bacterium]|nr:site-specific integrase [Clostridiales bacterium]
MATAKKTKTGWGIQIYLGKGPDGKRKYKRFTGPTKKAVEFMATSYREEVDRRNIPDKMTVGEAIDIYISNKDAVLSPKTIKEYKGYRKNYLQSLMNIRLGELTRNHIQQAVNEDAKTYSPKTLRNTHGLLSSALGAVMPDFNLKTALPMRKKAEIIIPTNDEVKTLLVASEKDDDLYKAILLGTFAGMRKSEICALSYGDVDKKEGRLRINKAKVQNSNNEWVIKGTKTYSSTRNIKVSSEVIDELLARQTSDMVITCSPNALTSRYRYTRDPLGFTFRFHDLRHYYASVMLSLGVPDKYAMQQMGHGTTNMLKTVYQHVMQDKKIEVEEQITTHFSSFFD